MIVAGLALPSCSKNPRPVMASTAAAPTASAERLDAAGSPPLDSGSELLDCGGPGFQGEEGPEGVWVAADPECHPICMRGIHVVSAREVLRIKGQLVTSPGRKTQVLSGFGERPGVGDHYVIFGPAGYGGSVRVTDREVGDEKCMWDACPGYRIIADWTHGPTGPSWPTEQPAVAPVIAVGPVAGPMPHATLPTNDLMDPAPVAKHPKGWLTELEMDLDGDGRVDVQRRSRRCGCYHLAFETRRRDGDAWTVTERTLNYGNIAPGWCVDGGQP
jgi:hypothetical protein